MNIKRAELLKSLKQGLPGIESGSSVLEGADLFVFRGGQVHSYNDFISVSVPIKSEGLIQEDIEGAVRAEEFYGIINKFPGEMIEFTSTAEKWILKCGRAKAELTLMAGDFGKRLDMVTPVEENWKPLSTEFVQGIGMCRNANNKSPISGVYVTSSDITSSDGNQIHHYRYEGVDITPFWISDGSAGELLKIGILSHIQVANTWVHFKTMDGTIFSVKTLQAEKWPYGKIMAAIEAHKKTNGAVGAVFPKKLFDAIDRANSFCFDVMDSKVVRLSITTEGITVSAERASGSFSEQVDWDEVIPSIPGFDLYVDISMMLFAARRSMSFYLHSGKGTAPRLIFVTDHSTHMIATISKEDIQTTKSEKKEGGNAKQVPAAEVSPVIPGTMFDEDGDEDGDDEDPPARPARANRPSIVRNRREESDEDEDLDLDKI